MVGSTDAAATFSIMRRLPITARLRATLEAESGFNDPPVIILVTVVASDAWSSSDPLQIGGLVVYQLAAGVLIGLAVARLGQWMLVRSALPSAGLYPLATMAILFLAFAVGGLAQASGLMAIYVAGMWLGNARLPHRQVTAGFADGLAWLAQIGLFVLLGLLASPDRLVEALPRPVGRCRPDLRGAAGVGARVRELVRDAAAPPGVRLLGWSARCGADRARDDPGGARAAVGRPDLRRRLPARGGLHPAPGPLLPWVARRTGVSVEAVPQELDVESAPLDEIDASLLQFEVPPGSRLAGVYVTDLRLPVQRCRRPGTPSRRDPVPDPHTSLEVGDHVLLAVSEAVRDETEHRLRAIGEHGRLALWYDRGGRGPGAAVRARRRSPGGRAPRASCAVPPWAAAIDGAAAGRAGWP